MLGPSYKQNRRLISGGGGGEREREKEREREIEREREREIERIFGLRQEWG